MKIRGSHLIALAIMGAIGGWMFTGDLILGGQANPNAESIAEREEKRSEDAFRVRVATVQPERRNEVLSVRGRTEADNRISVRAETAGRVERVAVSKGDTVAAGDLLCVIDLGIRNTSMAQAETALAQAQADFDANQQLLERGFTTRSRVRQLQTALDAAKSQLAATKQDMTRTEVRTTVAGQIAEPVADVGDNLAPAGVCATVVQLDPLIFTGQVSEQAIGAVRTGMSADVDLVDGRKVEGEITYVAPTADAQTRTFAVEVTLPNGDRSIREGLTASAAIPLNTSEAYK
ncbi:MAG: efflux RND transporter periplasmic adaptor subunit, partial [Pseudomonadota bacterium]